MSNYVEKPSPHLIHLSSQGQSYRRAADYILSQLKDPDSIKSAQAQADIAFSLASIYRLFANARDHYSFQALLLGSSIYNEFCATIVAQMIGLDEFSSMDRSEIRARIDGLINGFRRYEAGELNKCPWSIVALMASLKVISGTK